MTETIPGGCYKDPVGDGYHDANGVPVPEDKVAEYVKLQEAYAKEQAEVEAALIQRSLTPAQVLAQMVTAAKAEPVTVESTDTPKAKK